MRAARHSNITATTCGLAAATQAPVDCIVPKTSSSRVLVFSPNCLYAENLKTSLAWHQANYTESNLGIRSFSGIWLRDYYFTDYNLQKRIPHADYKEIATTAELSGASRAHFLQESAAHSYFQPVASTLHLRSYYEHQPVFPGGSCEASLLDIEGGDFLQATDTRGERKAILGLNSLLTAGHLYQKAFPDRSRFKLNLLHRNKRYLDDEDDHLDTSYTSNPAHYHEALRSFIAEELGLDSSDELVVIPQWLYHIDCAIAYVGNGIVLVHSFDETIKNYEHLGIPSKYRSRILHCLELNRALYEKNIIDRTCEILTRHNFKVVKCAGVINFQPDGRPVFENKMGLCVSNFMNGIAGTNADGTHYFLTNDSLLQGHKNLFSWTLHNLGINVEYLSVQGHVESGLMSSYLAAKQTFFDPYSDLLNYTMQAMTVTGGGLRCQLNFI